MGQTAVKHMHSIVVELQEAGISVTQQQVKYAAHTATTYLIETVKVWQR